MKLLRGYANRLKKITIQSQENALLRIIQDNQDFAVDLNTRQLLEGNDSNGEPLEPYRSPLYAEFKLTLNPKGVVDLRLTGDFHDSFFIDASKFPVVFGATDSKTAELIDKYGSEIFGLDQKSFASFADQIRPTVIEYYNRLLAL